MGVSIIAGGAGFVGSNLISLLSQEDRYLIVLDNLSRGRVGYLEAAQASHRGRIHVVPIDVSNQSLTLEAFQRASEFGRIDEVWHFAANSDIQAGVADPTVDLRDTFMTTLSLLNAMRELGVGVLHFASSSAIYGDLGENELHEGVGPLLPISNYGAMKLASEGLISAAVEAYLSRANLFRFPNVVGAPATHGVILDFIRRLKADHRNLSVLGDGSQNKAYLHVSDLVSAMIHVRNRRDLPRMFPVNIGPTDGGVTVRFIAESVCRRVSPGATISYGEGNKGWVGDVPYVKYSVARLLNLGWSPQLSSTQAVQTAIEEVALQENIPVVAVSRGWQ
jgi:UDP-glucose 4-epimerase